MAKVIPFPGWLERAGRRAETTLRSIPYEHLGPAGRRLIDALDASKSRQGVTTGTAHTGPTDDDTPIPHSGQ